MKPKVARIVSYLPVGGVEKRLLALLKRLKEDFEVEVICIHSRGKLAPLFEEAGIPVTVIPFKSRLHPVSLYRLAFYLRKRKVDIVHTHMYRPNISGTLAARLAGVPVVISNVHNVGHWDTPRQVFMDRLLHPLKDRIIAVSHAVREDIEEKTKVPLEKTVVIYNGVEWESFIKVDESPHQIKTSLKIPPGAFVISIIARLVPAKGHRYLFKAINALEEISVNLRVLVIGEGSYKSRLEEMARDMDLGSILFLGEREDIPSLLKVTHVSVLPSVKEGFSNVILESMAAGVPMVASEVGGAREAVEPFYTGVLVSPGDVDALKEELLNLLVGLISRKFMGLNGQRTVKRRFSIKRMVNQTRRLYFELLGEKK